MKHVPFWRHPGPRGLPALWEGASWGPWADCHGVVCIGLPSAALRSCFLFSPTFLLFLLPPISAGPLTPTRGLLPGDRSPAATQGHGRVGSSQMSCPALSCPITLSRSPAAARLGTSLPQSYQPWRLPAAL